MNASDHLLNFYDKIDVSGKLYRENNKPLSFVPENIESRISTPDLIINSNKNIPEDPASLKNSFTFWPGIRNNNKNKCESYFKILKFQRTRFLC